MSTYGKDGMEQEAPEQASSVPAGREDSYEDIIGLPHPTSAKHPRMSAADRAAQFSPFAALTGYEAVVAESGRLTEETPELTEDQKAVLDERLKEVLLRLEEEPEVRLTCFMQDPYKPGGARVTAEGTVRSVDLNERMLTLADGRRIDLDDLLEIEIL